MLLWLRYISFNNRFMLTSFAGHDSFNDNYIEWMNKLKLLPSEEQVSNTPGWNIFHIRYSWIGVSSGYYLSSLNRNRTLIHFNFPKVFGNCKKPNSNYLWVWCHDILKSSSNESNLKWNNFIKFIQWFKISALYHREKKRNYLAPT